MQMVIYLIRVFFFVFTFHYTLSATCEEGVTSGPSKVDFSGTKPYHECSYDFKLGRKRVARFRFSKFKFNGKMPECEKADRVKVYVGCKRKRHIALFCSEGITPHDIYARDGCITIRISFNSKNNFRSLEGTFKEVNNDGENLLPPCHKNVYDMGYTSSGVIASPDWPGDYRGEMDWKSCSWLVKGISEKEVQINVMDFALVENFFQYSSLTKCEDDDTVTITGWRPNEDSASIREYCHQLNPFIRSTTYYKFQVDLAKTSGYGRKQRGFILGYVFYDRNLKLVKNEGSFTVIIVVLAAVFFVIVLVGVICQTMRKRSEADAAMREVELDRLRQQEETIMNGFNNPYTRQNEPQNLVRRLSESPMSQNRHLEVIDMTGLESTQLQGQSHSYNDLGSMSESPPLPTRNQSNLDNNPPPSYQEAIHTHSDQLPSYEEAVSNPV